MSIHDDQLDGDARALRQLIEDVRAEPTPQLDWEEIEQRLMSRVELEAAARRRQQSSRKRSWPGVLGLVAAAAAVVLLVTHAGPGASRASSAGAPAAVDLAGLTSDVRDGQPTYAVGDLSARAVVESGDEPVRFALPGVVTWTLAPHSRVRLQSARAPQRLTLEQGSVHAEVVPASRSDQLVESFVVEAAGTRVAVHGTVLSVTRQVDRVEVEVNRGSVTVGPAGHRGVTTGRLLVGPAHASFGLDGSFREMLARPAPAPVAAAERDDRGPATNTQPPGDSSDDEPTPVVSAPATVTTTADAGTEAPAEPAGSGEVDPGAITVAQAQALVAGCLNASAPAVESDDTEVIVSSQVTAVLDAEGQVSSVRFAPPLRPDLQSRCGSTLFGHRVSATTSKITFPVQVSSR